MSTCMLDIGGIGAIWEGEKLEKMAVLEEVPVGVLPGEGHLHYRELWSSILARGTRFASHRQEVLGSDKQQEFHWI